MKATEVISPLVRAVRQADTSWQRRRSPHVRDVAFDASTAMEYGMMAPVHRRLLTDARVRTWLMSSAHADRVREIFQAAPSGTPVLSPRAAMTRRFDACVTAHFHWATLPRGTRRVQMFHGVAGKFGPEFDRPETSMREWDRLFFINRRRLHNFVASGAIDRDSSAIRLVGMPKSDCLVDGSLTRAGVLASNGMDPARTTILYAPTWTRFSSLNLMGEDVVRRLIEAGYRVLVKLHELSLNPLFINSGGVDWIRRLQPLLAAGDGHLIQSSDASPWLVAADALITDHSSIGFEYMLVDRPLIRINVPELISATHISTEYVDLMVAASTTVHTATEAVAAVDRGVANPAQGSTARRAVAAELFHDAGRATDRAVAELYELIELDLPDGATPAVTVQPVSGGERTVTQ